MGKPQDKGRGDGGLYNVLVCDDEKDIVAALKIYLSSGDYRVYEAYSGSEAIEIVGKNDIQLILMDIMMPGMDGIGRYREDQRDVKCSDHSAHRQK